MPTINTKWRIVRILLSTKEACCNTLQTVTREEIVLRSVSYSKYSVNNMDNMEIQ